jgi:protein phosphatase
MHDDRSSNAVRPVAVGISDVGRQRELNEDHLLIAPKLSLFAVADGMGGHSAGDVASKLTAVSLFNFFEATQADPGAAHIADRPELPPEARRLIAGVCKANSDVFEISSTFTEHKGMGSTIVALHFSRSMIHLAHVGDSRCYRIRDGEIQQLTRDHSLINDALELKPDLTPKELARLPKNVITRALGMGKTVQVDVQSQPALLRDVYLLCSDGLTGMVNPTQILEVFDITEDLNEACELLIAMANEAGGTDNISALLIRMEEAEQPRSAPVVTIETASLTPPSIEAASVEPASIQPISIQPISITPLYGGPLEELDGGGAPEMLELLEAGAEVDLRAVAVGVEPVVYDAERCRKCGFELYEGNAFCTECGTRV